MVDTGVQVRVATTDEAADIVAVIEDAAAWLTAQGVQQWPPGFHRANQRYFEEKWARGFVLLALEAGHAIGCGIVAKSDEYGIWDAECNSAAYLSKLAIRHVAKGRGLGGLLLDCAEKHVRNEGRKIMRLDCIADNVVLCQYYERAGYVAVGMGEIHGYPVQLYEKSIA